MSIDTFGRGLVVAALALAAACGDSGSEADAGATSDAAPAPDGAVPPRQVSTTSGPVVGHADGATTAFLGIPYAAPPTGERRWRPPVAPAPWTEPRIAEGFGPACPQKAAARDQDLVQDEDCLSLNVWTPALVPAASLPVMVFVHGGGFRRGASSSELYDGALLAAAGPVVVVTLNYRLGAIGFLAHAALSGESEHGVSGNYGLLDQQAALRWVRDNIAGFGGDPQNVTFFGESAGAMSLCAHMVSPLAAGLFHRAIGESGPCSTMTTPLRAAAGTPSGEGLGATLAGVLGCGDAADVAACLRAVPAATVVEASQQPGEVGGARYQPIVDGYVLPEAPMAALAAGRFAALDAFIAGTNRDEATMFTQQRTMETAADFVEVVGGIVPAHVDDVLALYPPASYPTVKDAYNAFVTDLWFTCPTRALTRFVAAKGTPAYLYHFTRPTAVGAALGLGVYHGSELAFVFGTFGDRTAPTPGELAMSAAMMGYWTGLATAGTPGGEVAWPARTAVRDDYLELGLVIRASTGLHAEACDAMESWAR
jgi:para-nitrobenzyl esterase